MIDLVLGDRIELDIGAPAHGGHCVGRYRGIVVFVRHALPGEQVIASITEVHKGYARADTVSVLRASPDRVAAPCRYSGPDACGGCDLQHARGPAQLAWKASVVREQLDRLAGLADYPVTVEPLPGNGLGWRTRIAYHVDALGRPGLLKHRSNEVVPIDRCLIAHPAIQELDVLAETWPDADVVDVVKPYRGKAQLVAGQRITEHAAGHDFELSANTFWQVHPDAADTLAACVLDFLGPRPGETAWDLYGGAGLFSVALRDRGCEVTMVESVPDRRNLTGIHVIESSVERARLPQDVDLIVLDPPRSGAGAAVVRKIARAGRRAIVYVACDPAALARDLRTFAGNGWELSRLRAFDLFPQTHHVECVALLTNPKVGDHVNGW